MPHMSFEPLVSSEHHFVTSSAVSKGVLIGVVIYLRANPLLGRGYCFQWLCVAA